ncbi:response regulator [Halomonas urumqiensis]|uniref:DNA-binding response regulator n=1 Tax=Halomonas urumqiensis TaxID=1684789 RepID=A0A2N7UDR0_9GAMM|nr:response regulator [Halomonas urumqiensis]PMR78569.1 DNA-binding response regulator [Halomonas urumqiensis]PTB03713.1 DNA-binding response regulator [Halomonas urumqiensis]GHE20068.1 DNA-binding response regulator [Halomonas urumqiensis]
MTSTPATLIVVDDDPEIRELLADYLGRHGYRALMAEDAQALYRLLESESPALLIVDIMMPGDDGLTICRELRRASEVPIIMLTASADETDRILGLELGADDYLGKPFNPRELLARIKAVLRRTRVAAQPTATDQPRRVAFGDWQLDRMTRELIDRHGQRSGLSGADFQLLQVFLEHPEQVLSREDLFTRTRGRPAPDLDRSIDVHVCRLRQRLGEDAQHSQLIRTVRGVGYVLTARVERLP